MEKKLGVYLCSGCGIADAVDMEKLASVATGEMKAPICRTHPFMCGKEGSSLITADIKNEGGNTVAIAACSPRVMYDVFSYDPRIVLERSNLRERVACCQPGAEMPEGKEGEEAPADAKPVVNAATQ